ncbi:hypothetical protein EMPS_11256 [Entomortierella parvispora]|uniref:Major facilitator superfamily (MFS) profile domain-containing protein n=1 Tax=Entomortierella parvispora TaxID=205924 RepID=A0A9P3HLI2_9FUNG|nr:hypothetical protein EMPS_11256 [Entomortierella parvispora]
MAPIEPSPSTLRPWHRRLDENKGLLLFAVSTAQLLDMISMSAVTITLPAVMRDVGFKVNQLQWVTSAYALTYGAFLLLGGRLGDLSSHRRIYLLGVTWFSIWALVNGFAKDPIVMSVGRALQGIGAAFTIPSALALLTTTYPAGPERTKALAIFSGTGAMGSVVGVLLGGILGSTIGWRWIFYITSTLGFLMGIMGVLVIPVRDNELTVTDRRVDYVGTTSFTLGIVAVIYYLSQGPVTGWASASTLAPFLVGMALFVLFVFWESRIEYPIMPLRIWKSQRFIASCLGITMISACLNAMAYFSSLALQNVLGYTALKSSYAYVIHGVGAMVMMVLTTNVLAKVRTKIVTLVGWMFLIAAGCCWAQIQTTSSYGSIPVPALLLNCMGLAPCFLCLQINSVAEAKDEDQGVVGACYNTFLQIGTPVGIAVSNIIANSINPATATKAALLPGYHAAFYSYAGMAGVGFLITLFLAPNRDPASMRQQQGASALDKTEVDLESSVPSEGETRAPTPEEGIKESQS